MHLSVLIGILCLGGVVDLWGEITDMIAFALYTSSLNEKSEICANKRTQHAASLQKYEGSKCSVLSFFWSKNGQKWKITLSLLGKRRVVPLWSRFKGGEKGVDFFVL